MMDFTFRRAIGPECPYCGCNGANIAAAGDKGGYRWARFVCRNETCAREFTIGQEPPAKVETSKMVAYQRTRCPLCNQPARIYRTMPKMKTGAQIRYHRCENCRYSFASYDAEG